MRFLKGDETDDDKPVVEGLAALRSRLLREFTPEQIRSAPKMLWKSAALYQCIYRRVVESTDGLRAAWNAGNLITTVTMARSLIETGAIAQKLTDGVLEATEKKDIDALD